MTSQEQYWQLSSRLALATLEVQQAEAAIATFFRAHAGEEFLVFRPEDIERFRQSATRGNEHHEDIHDGQ